MQCILRGSVSIKTSRYTHYSILSLLQTSLEHAGSRRLMGPSPNGCRLISSDSSNNGSTSESARQQFKQLPVDPSILRHIQGLGIGIGLRRTKRRQRASRLASTGPRRGGGRSGSALAAVSPEPMLAPSPHSLRAPPPFGKESQPVSVIASITTVGEIQSVRTNKRPDGRAVVPEVALAGRSNVGKSTLLNNLLYGSREETKEATPAAGRRRRSSVDNLQKLPKGHKATVSARPGETRAITIFQLASSSHENRPRLLRLVDLPGYGFAFASPADHDNYQATMSRYLLHRGSPLKRLLLLVDARHGMKRADFDFLEALQKHVKTQSTTKEAREVLAVGKLPPIQLVLTKCDLVEQADLARRVVQVKNQLSDSLVRETSRLPVMLVSARAGPGQKLNAGLLELQKELAALIPAPLDQTS